MFSIHLYTVYSATAEDTQLVMTDRKGFVKISIENGLDIIPGFCFGEKR